MTNLVHSIKELGLEYDIEAENYSISNGPFCTIWVSFNRAEDRGVEVGMLDVCSEGMFDMFDLFYIADDTDDELDETDELLVYLTSLLDKMNTDDINTQLMRGVGVKKVVNNFNDIVGEQRFELK
jgi:hypothetical protein